MIFALGFLTAGLFVLLFLPAVWKRAMRLSRRRIERQIPLSMEEVVAERDRLRGECAVAQRIAEQKTEKLARARAHDLGELGRRATRIVQLEAEAEDRRVTVDELETRLSGLHRSLAETEGELGAVAKELYDSAGLLGRTREEVEDLRAERRRLEEVAERQRATIASIQASLEIAQVRIGDLDQRLRETERLYQQKLRELQLVANASDSALKEVSLMQMRHAALEARVNAQTEQVTRLRSLPVVAERARVAAANDTAPPAAAKPAETIESARIAGLEKELERAAAAAREVERDLRKRLEALRGENAALLRTIQLSGSSSKLPSSEPAEGPTDGERLVERGDRSAELEVVAEPNAEGRRLAASPESVTWTARAAEAKAWRDRVAGRDGARTHTTPSQGLPDHAGAPPPQAARQ